MSTVLLLEDLDSDANALESALRGLGDFKLQRFRAASLAVESLSDALGRGDELPVLVIVDLNLPDSSGYELLRFYHSTPKLQGVPIAVWSVLDSPADQKLTKWMGSRKLISKNSGPAALRKSLASLLKTKPAPKH